MDTKETRGERSTAQGADRMEAMQQQITDLEDKLRARDETIDRQQATIRGQQAQLSRRDGRRIRQEKAAQEQIAPAMRRLYQERREQEELLDRFRTEVAYLQVQLEQRAPPQVVNQTNTTEIRYASPERHEELLERLNTIRANQLRTFEVLQRSRQHQHDMVAVLERTNEQMRADAAHRHEEMVRLVDRTAHQDEQLARLTAELAQLRGSISR